MPDRRPQWAIESCRMRSKPARRVQWLLAQLLLALAPTRCQEPTVPSPTSAPALGPSSVDDDAAPASGVEGPLDATAEPGLLVYADTTEAFMEAVLDPFISHIVVIAHLDLSGAPPVNTVSLAVARVLPTLKSIKGECPSVPAVARARLPDGLVIPEGACFIRVLHAWLDVVATAEQHGTGQHTLWVSGFVVQAARPAADLQEAPLVAMTGVNAWLASMVLVGDGFFGRGIRITEGEVYIGDSAFVGFRSLEGAAVWFGGSFGTLTLAASTFTGNAASARFGAAVLVDEGDVLLSACTFAGNGENEVAVRGGAVWTTDTDRPINVYNAQTRQVASAAQFDNATAVAAPEGVPFDDFYEYYFPDDYVGLAPVPADAAEPAAAPTVLAAAGTLPETGAATTLVPNFPSADDAAVADIRQEQAAAVLQTPPPVEAPPELPALEVGLDEGGASCDLRHATVAAAAAALVAALLAAAA
eukprot:jgi/Ulvmu1/12458/UM009_0110.1